MNTFSLVIVHGRSEFELVQAIKRFMRLNIIIYARNKGKSSIQVDSLSKMLKTDQVLKNCTNIVERYPRHFAR